MENSSIRLTLSGGILLAALGSGPAGAQETLPEIDIAAPSPIRRAPTTAQPAAPETRGVLPIVADQFATVTVVDSDEIRRSGGATLGDLLFDKPGITGSSFAPGAASRPIVRGLDAHRVRIQENGLGSSGVSELGEDHGVPLDPLGADRVEVVRGPATLRWGSQAIGGVVNATNNRIPEALPCRGDETLPGPCTRLETRSAVSTVDAGLEQAALVDVGQGNFALHADAHGRRTSNYAIPSYPYLAPTDPAPLVFGRQPNSFMRSGGWSAGGSYIFDRGFFGASVTQFESVYRIPGMDSTESRTRIQLRQTKVAVKGEYRPPASFIEAIRLWAGASDYNHHEIGLEGGAEGIQQTFTNQEQEARIEAQLAPFDLRFAKLTTAFGVQGAHQRLTAPGAGGNLFDPTDSHSIAFYLFNEFQLTQALRLQVAGRIESVETTGQTPDLFLDPTTSFQYDRHFTPKSIAVGLLHDLPFDTVGSVTAQHVERAPRGPELFSHGVHDATGTFDIGNPLLGIEAANTVEVGLRRAKGPFRFEATFFYTHFDGFIYRRLSGETCADDFDSCSPAGAGGPLNQALYSQRDANFRGGEFQSQWDALQIAGGILGVENKFDVVRATFSDGTNVPRIPPVRAGGGVFWRDSNWLARVSYLHAFAQNNVATIAETPTKGYNLLKAEISYRVTLPKGEFPAREMSVGIVGDNLLNADIRNSVSYKKDEVPMPGANVRLFANFVF
ncbi:iron complex outermembrane receptor protein [Methylosinus sp. sav-2]|uniref:TonB-dependent receptor n=1 Tax=Methylosinus sp. sav-2 TaxID=2485168 RepID=UPI00047B0A2C|nr:TonB-dependent receptor [Methylosinus sp. sav-2]TDX65575.1 iron complex outermembrane receptor protein [Methylosinus sp. sav-2]